MSQQLWRVSYKDPKRNLRGVIIEWPSEPTVEQAAIRIREQLLGKEYLLVDIPRGHAEPTVFLLESYGFKILGVEKVVE